jgi:uncharacterized protein YdhG (YjbR/CyaY superfamily)
MAAASIDDYLAQTPEPAREVLARFRAIAHELAPDVTESISYGMPTFALPGRHRFHLGAWAKHVGVYPVRPAPAELEAQLTPLRAAKDTVQWPLTPPFDDALARQLVAFLLERAA